MLEIEHEHTFARQDVFECVFLENVKCIDYVCMCMCAL